MASERLCEKIPCPGFPSPTVWHVPEKKILFVFNILLGGKLVLLSSGGLLKVFTLFDVV